MNTLSKTITNQKPSICIIGPGIVGLATGQAFIDHKFPVAFLGGRKERREDLQKQGYKTYAKENLFSNNYNFDISFLTVPTPTHDGTIDLSFIDSASKDLGKRLKNTKKYHLVVVKSTVLPGTTENIVLKNIEKYSGKKVGIDFGICMNPEYLREVSAYEDSVNPWVITIGEYDKKSGDLLSSIYEDFDARIYRVSIKEAEMQKYVHNLFNAVKISFFNEMRGIANLLGANPDKVFQITAFSAEGLWNPFYGLRDRGPFSGSCLPKDTQAFLNLTEEKNLDASLLRTAIEVNNRLLSKSGIPKYTPKSAVPL